MGAAWRILKDELSRACLFSLAEYRPRPFAFRRKPA